MIAALGVISIPEVQWGKLISRLIGASDFVVYTPSLLRLLCSLIMRNMNIFLVVSAVSRASISVCSGT
jgi:hypothetical protein